MIDELLSIQEFYVRRLQSLNTEDNIKAYNEALKDIRIEDEDTDAMIRLAGSSYYKIGDTAYLSIKGFISRDWTFETWVSGGRPLKHLEALFDDAERDEEVKNIQLLFDTPGGSVSGVSEFFDKIYNSKKIVSAHAQGTMASAGYWLASAAKSITATKTSIIGSVGVMLEILDTTKLDENMGIKRHVFKSTGAEMKNAEVGNEKADKHYQEYVDSVFDIMRSDIARGRGIDPESVADKYGNGAVFVASKAVSMGMIDSIINKSIVVDANESSVEENTLRGVEMPDKKTEASAVVKPVEVDTNAIIASERKRILDITALGFGSVTKDIISNAIDEGWTVGDTAIAVNKAIIEHTKTVASDRLKDAEVITSVKGSLESEEDIPDTVNALGLSQNATNTALDNMIEKMKGDK